MEQIYEVIIIGAGVSGIGASMGLKHQKLPHLILESSDRPGGRIHSQQFAGVAVDMGATFLHNPSRGNAVYEYINSNNLETVQAPQDEEYYYEGRGKLDQQDLQRVQQLEQQAHKIMDKRAKKNKSDISLEEAMEEFIEEEVDGQEPCVRDSVIWKLKMEGNIEGAEMSQLSAKFQSVEQRKNDLLVVGGGYPLIFQRLYQQCQPTVKYNSRVLSIDYSGSYVRITTTNGIFSANRVISSLPLGVLQSGSVHFTPQLSPSYQEAIKSIGNGNQNKLFCLFRKPFWQNRSGWINFVVRAGQNRYPIGFIYPNNIGRHILLVFVSGKTCDEMLEKRDEDICQDFNKFLKRFIQPADFDLQQVKMSRWHKNPHAQGSYCFKKVGTQKKHFKQLRKPIQNKLWFVGEHTHPVLSAYAHGAYQTGLWAAEEVLKSMNGDLVQLDSQQSERGEQSVEL